MDNACILITIILAVCQLPGAHHVFVRVRFGRKATKPHLWIECTGCFVKSALVQRDEASEESYDYGMVLASSRSQGIDFWGASTAFQRPPVHNYCATSKHSTRFAADLPGYTRSAYEADHALITPESRVFAGMPGW